MRLGDCVVGVLAAGMGGTLLSGVDLDVVLQWSDMQRMMDELSETEEDTGSSDENLSASDIMSATGDLSDSLGPLVSRGSSFASESLLSGGLGGESLLSGGMNGIRPLLDSRHLLNAARADAKMSSHISSLLQSRAAGGNLDDSLGGHEELQSFLPPLLFGSRPFQRSQSMGSLYGRPSSPSSRDGEDEDDDGWMRDATPGPGGKARPGATDEKSGSGKTRFVWSAELHARFEQAVAKLGVDRAKPQARASATLAPATPRAHTAARLSAAPSPGLPSQRALPHNQPGGPHMWPSHACTACPHASVTGDLAAHGCRGGQRPHEAEHQEPPAEVSAAREEARGAGSRGGRQW